MSNIDDFFSSSSGGIPKLPTAVKHRANLNSTVAGGSLGNLPMITPGTNRTQLRMPDSTNALTDSYLYLEDDVTIWTITITNVNTALTLALTAWTGLHWFDNVDDLFYFVLRDATPGYSLITIDRAGTIALVGTDTEANLGMVFSTSAANQWWERSAQGSGDFSIYIGTEVATISSSTGAVTAIGANFVLTGATDKIINSNFRGYISNDKKIAVSGGRVDNYVAGVTQTQVINLSLTRGDSSGSFGINPGELGWSFSELETASVEIRFEKWDGKLVITASPRATASVISASLAGPRVFEIADFDGWLHDIGNFIGLEGSA